MFFNDFGLLFSPATSGIRRWRSHNPEVARTPGWTVRLHNTQHSLTLFGSFAEGLKCHEMRKQARCFTCYSQWCRNEFESGGTHTAQSALHFFWLHKYNSSFWWALSWWSVQFVKFLVCCYSAHGASRAQPFVKVESTCPLPGALYGVGATGYSCPCKVRRQQSVRNANQ